MPKINKAYTTSNFRKKFDNLSKEVQKITVSKIIIFENNFLHPGLNVHKLKGKFSAFWAFYVTKNYRILFRFLKANEVIYYDIDTHDIYK